MSRAKNSIARICCPLGHRLIGYVTETYSNIKAGKLLSTSAQFPKDIGRIAAEKTYEHFAGKAVEKDIKVRVQLITRENADSFLLKKE